MSADINQLEPNQITVLLDKASTGDEAAFDELIPIIYPELKLIASGLRRKNSYGSKTLNTTALVNEVWLKLHKYGVKAKSRKHFYCICAKSMRQKMLNSAKKKLAKKPQRFIAEYLKPQKVYLIRRYPIFFEPYGGRRCSTSQKR